MVYKFLEDTANEAKSQGDTDKAQAYQKVHILFLNRNIKLKKDMEQLVVHE